MGVDECLRCLGRWKIGSGTTGDARKYEDIENLGVRREDG